MKTLCIVLTLGLAATLSAETVAPAAPKSAKPAPNRASSSDRAAARERMMRKLGGFIDNPSAQKGLVLVLDAQKEVPAEPIKEMVGRLADVSLINFRYAPEDPAVIAAGDWQGLLKAKGATAVVAVVYDDKSAPLIVSPDEQWAVVNVKRLEFGLNADGKARFLPDRTCKQILRAFALMSGSASRFRLSPGSSLGLDELDRRGDMLPMDQIQQLSDYLGKRGVTHKARIAYRKACQEGWAPPPTNDIQKAVWDEVHTLPTNPLPLVKPTK